MNLSKLSTLATLVTLVAIAVSIFGPVGMGSAQADQNTVPLGSTATFAILAGTSITNTGATIVNGDLGVSPGATVTGFDGVPDGTVNGIMHVNDVAAGTAQGDLTIAYDNAAGRSATTVDTELGGTTKYTGVYKTDAGTLEITGDLTLDANGDPDAVFIFQAGSTLITAAGSRVILINNAQASNVFWQVTSSATLGADSVFQGNILALTSITVGNSATVTGRLLARNGTVSLDTNTVTLPPPRVTAILPVSGPATGGTAVTITGTNFITGATVTIGGVAATDVTFVNATSITATTPAGTAGAKDVVVTNPDNQIGTLTSGFTYVAPIFTLIAPTDIGLLRTAGTFSEGINTGFSATAGSVVTNGVGWTLAVSDTKTNTKGHMTIGGTDAGAPLATAIQIGMTSDTLTTIPSYQGQLVTAAGYGETGTFSIPLYASQTVVGTDAAGSYRITLTYTATPPTSY